MNKKSALVTLIETSFMLTDNDKLMLIDTVPSLNDRQVDALGLYFAKEREMVLEHRKELSDFMLTILSDLGRDDDRVYTGSGKPG